MKLREFLFRSRQEKKLAGLQGKVQIMAHGGRRSPLDFYCLGKDLESYRDLLADYLDGLPTAERAAVEGGLWPGVHALVERVNKLTDEAIKARVIDEALGSDVQMVGIALLGVCALTKLVV
jgi:hypothetical protein